MVEQLDIKKTLTEIELHGFRRWLEVQLMRAFEEARKNKLKTMDENRFEMNSIKNIERLATAIMERTYKPGASICFVVFDPMVREIFAAAFRDRVVHHLLYNMQAGWWDRRFIYDSYSCREGKGTLMGIRRAQRYMRVASNNFTEPAHILKFDLKGFFMSILRARLLERVKWGMDRQFAGYLNEPAGRQLYDMCLFLWTQVIMDDPVEKAQRRGPLDDWRKVPPEKSLFCQPPGKGIVIGNLTSQLASNIYLDQLDRFVTMELGYKCYGRYVDDFYIIVNGERYRRMLKEVKVLEEFISEQLDGTLHPRKRYIQPVRHGMQFLGARVYPHAIVPSDRLQAKFRRTMKGFIKGHKGYDSVQSYIGLMKHMDSEEFIRSVFEEMGWGGEFWEL